MPGKIKKKYIRKYIKEIVPPTDSQKLEAVRSPCSLPCQPHWFSSVCSFYK